jgi:ribonuclease HI
LKHFNVSIHHPNPIVIKEVLWQPPLINWVKCNIDGAAKGNPGTASCGGVFRNHAAELVYCFAEPLGKTSSFQAELCAAMRAIEVAHIMNLNNLWLESDSELVVHAFKNTNFMVAWNLRNRWHNAKLLLSHMNYIVSHIYREGNQVADTLANYGCSLSSLTCWHYVPDFVKDNFVKNILGIPSFRICNS